MRDPVVVVGPAGEPVTLDEVKTHLRIDDQSGDERWLLSAIRTAREDVESFTGRALITQTLELTLDRWPAGETLALPRPPLQSVASIQYTDRQGVEATLATESYLVDTRQAVVWLRYGYSWPGASLREAAGVVVRYTAGYGAAEAVPARLRHAILMLVGHLYENREATSQAGALTATPMGVERLLWPYRVAF